MTAGKALLVTVVLAAAALAGCAADDAEGARSEPLTKGGSGASSSGTSSALPPPAPKPKGTSERWHFHDYWKGNPTITLLDQDVNLTAVQGADGLPSFGAIVLLPNGVIVPPETGLLAINVTWPGPTEGLMNVTFKPADSPDFQPLADLGRAEGIVLPTTESMADVPHRQQSAWAFNLTARPGGAPPALPPQTVRLTLNATIGRPLFIDPPHLNWWQGNDTIPLIAGASGSFAGARSTQAGNLTLPGVPATPSVPPSVPTATALTAPQRVPVDAGRIVPEGAKSVVAILTWTATAPGGKLGLRFQEENLPSAGPLEVVAETETSRTFVLAIAQAQTDTTYSNRTTWQFHVVPDGDPAAFQGDYALTAWVSQLAPTEAVVAVSRA